jgi:hypothetical protein
MPGARRPGCTPNAGGEDDEQQRHGTQARRASPAAQRASKGPP